MTQQNELVNEQKIAGKNVVDGIEMLRQKKKKKKKVRKTYYHVSGGPVRITCHSNGLDSSTRPAEKPESVFFLSSVQQYA